jgi:hypothetical protein
MGRFPKVSRSLGVGTRTFSAFMRRAVALSIFERLGTVGEPDRIRTELAELPSA